MTNPIPHLHINLEIKDQNLKKNVIEFVGNHFHHLRTHVDQYESRYYNLDLKYHELLKLKINVLYINNSIGKNILTYITDETDLYRDNSNKQLGNIKENEYLFVRGEIADYYVI